MAITLVGSATPARGGAGTATITRTVTAGNTVVVSVSHQSGAVATIGDNAAGGSNTWTLAGDSTTAGATSQRIVAIYYCVNVKAFTSLTVTGTSVIQLFLDEFAGVSAFSNAAVAARTSSASPAPATVGTVRTGDLVIGVLGYVEVTAGTRQDTLSAGYTQTSTFDNAGASTTRTSGAYALTVSGTTGPTWTMSPAASTGFVTAWFIPPNSGSGTGSYSFTGAGTSNTAHKGLSSGTYSFTGAGSSNTAHQGLGSGVYSFTGGATGDAPANHGASSGTYSFTGGATSVNPHQGLAAGTYSYVGTATSNTTHKGSGTGAYAFAGAATGDMPANHGGATGAYSYVGGGTGLMPTVVTHAGACTGSYTFIGSGTGLRPVVAIHAGSAGGAYAWAGVASSHVTHTGSATGTHHWTGGGVGLRPVIPPHNGQASGVYSWVGGGTGFNDNGFIAATDPRASIGINPHRAKIMRNTHSAQMGSEEIDVDNYVAGDLLPPFTATLFNGGEPYDPTLATSVHVKIWQDGVLLVNRPATTATADGVVTCDWVAGDTDEPGPLKARVVVNKGGKDESFPPDGYLITKIHPATP